MKSLQQIDQLLILTPKFLNFSVGLAASSLNLFRITFCREYLGFDEQQAGIMTATIATSGFISMMLWGRIADWAGVHGRLLRILPIGLYFCFQCFVFAPVQPIARFYYALVCFVGYGAFFGGIPPLCDYQTLRLLEEKYEHGASLYGRQRLWNSLAYAVITIIVNGLAGFFGISVLFWIIPICVANLVIVVCLFALPDCGKGKLWGDNCVDDHDSIDDSPEKDCDPLPEKSIKSDLLRNTRFLVSTFSIFMSGISYQFVQIFLKYISDKEIEQSPLQLNVNVAIATAAVIVGMASVVWLLDRIGTMAVLVIGQSGLLARVWIYVGLAGDLGRLESWVNVLLYSSSMMSGLSFAFVLVASVKVAVTEAPLGLRATTQSIVMAIYTLFPTALSSVVGGALLKSYSSRMSFFYFACFCSVSMLISLSLIIAMVIFTEKKKSDALLKTL